MSGPDTFPGNRGSETPLFRKEDLLKGFRDFISQRKLGRPFPAAITKNESARGFSVIAKAIEELDIEQTEPETFSKALDYFCEIDQAAGFYHLSIRGDSQFEAVRLQIVKFLLTKDPHTAEDFHYFIRDYVYLRLPEPTGIVASWRKRKKGVYDEASYLESLEISKAVRYIRKRLAEIK